jgi:hypothetical protein
VVLIVRTALALLAVVHRHSSQQFIDNRFNVNHGRIKKFDTVISGIAQQQRELRTGKDEPFDAIIGRHPLRNV